MTPCDPSFDPHDLKEEEVWPRGCDRGMGGVQKLLFFFFFFLLGRGRGVQKLQKNNYFFQNFKNCHNTKKAYI